MITHKIKAAMDLAMDAHEGFTHGKGRYAVHCVEVMCILIEHGITDEDTLIVALLHDTIEDTWVDYTHIRKLFGKKVVDSVVMLTDDSRLSRQMQLELQILGMTKKDVMSISVKFADRIANLRKSSGQRPPTGRRLDHSAELLEAGVVRLRLLEKEGHCDHPAHPVWALTETLSSTIEQHMNGAF